MFLLSSALKNEDFIFKKKKEEDIDKKKITTKNKDSNSRRWNCWERPYRFIVKI